MDGMTTLQCPFCGDKRRLVLLQTHIAEHLEALALFVLPGNADEEYGTSNNSYEVVDGDLPSRLKDSASDASSIYQDAVFGYEDTLAIPDETAFAQSARKEEENMERKRDAVRQAMFQEASDEALNIPLGYLKVAVKIIRWDESIDDFKGHTEEVSTSYHGLAAVAFLTWFLD